MSADTGRAATAAAPLQRLLAIDLMRGLVMVLMAIDHSSDAFNAGRVFTDAARLYHAGTALPVAQFLVRWLTHLCAPTFLFLAGVGLSFTVKRERSRGKSERGIDGYLLTRGLLIAAFELWISYFVMPKGVYLFQVLYAIGTSYLFMIPLRRLPNRVVWAVAIGLMVSLELACSLITQHFGANPPLWATLLFVGGQPAHLVVGYPTLHWLSLLLLGFGFGNYLIERPQTPAQLSGKLLAAGGLLLLGFAGIRGSNGYGNMGLFRDDDSFVQWLHVSKYPPGLSYISLELGICFLVLAACFALSAKRAPKSSNPLLVFGQTPMFFYLLHFPLLLESAHFLGVEGKLGLGAALLGAAAVVIALYPVCRAYRTYKVAHKEGWTRFI